MSGLEVITGDLRKHPKCPHGPTLLFSRSGEDGPRRFFACSACRDRKDCKFFLYEDELKDFGKKKKAQWDERSRKYVYGINHQNLFLTFNEVMNESAGSRMYCHDCGSFQLSKYKMKHRDHKHIEGISDSMLQSPSEFLTPLNNTKLEAQYLFSKASVEMIVDMLRKQNLKNIICIGAPRVHEHITKSHPDMSSILLDIDKRYLHFFGPLQFCWYNLFNNYFFLKGSQDVFEDFLQSNKGKDTAIVTDPPFGGRTEALGDSLKQINSLHQNLNKTEMDIPIFWISPYFMEPQIKNDLPSLQMLDYMVEYDNHPLFAKGPKGRKQGSPVRIFTNVDPSLIPLPEEEYKFCQKCKRWVYQENKHCKKCNSCTSKDGRTYSHCNKCNRCVKPTWSHCAECGICAQQGHSCKKIEFKQECFICKERGHKKIDCPTLKRESVKRKEMVSPKRKVKKIKKLC